MVHINLSYTDSNNFSLISVVSIENATLDDETRALASSNNHNVVITVHDIGMQITAELSDPTNFPMAVHETIEHIMQVLTTVKEVENGKIAVKH